VKCLDFSNDSTKLATGGKERILQVFDLNKYTPIMNLGIGTKTNMMIEKDIGIRFTTTGIGTGIGIGIGNGAGSGPEIGITRDYFLPTNMFMPSFNISNPCCINFNPHTSGSLLSCPSYKNSSDNPPVYTCAKLAVDYGIDNLAFGTASNQHIIWFTIYKQPGVMIWDIRVPMSALTLSLPTHDFVTKMNMSCDRKTVAVSTKSSVYFFDANNMTLLQKYKLTLQSTKNELYCVAVNNARTKFVVGQANEMHCRLFDFENGKELMCCHHKKPVRCVCFSPNGLTFASGSEDSNVMIWNTCTNLT